MYGERVGLGANLFQSCRGFMNRLAQMIQRVLEPISPTLSFPAPFGVDAAGGGPGGFFCL
jgi:hypothetical protein